MILHSHWRQESAFKTISSDNAKASLKLQWVNPQQCVSLCWTRELPKCFMVWLSDFDMATSKYSIENTNMVDFKAIILRDCECLVHYIVSWFLLRWVVKLPFKHTIWCVLPIKWNENVLSTAISTNERTQWETIFKRQVLLNNLHLRGILVNCNFYSHKNILLVKSFVLKRADYQLQLLHVNQNLQECAFSPLPANTS